MDGEHEWTSSESLTWLCRERDVHSFVEVGVYRAWISGGLLADSNLRITRCYMIDPWMSYEDNSLRDRNPSGALQMRSGEQAEWEAAYQSVLDQVAGFGDRAVVMRMRSLDAAPSFDDGSVDFAYIDGKHERVSVLEDIGAWMPKVKPGGIIGGHDFDVLADVNAAVLECFPEDALGFLPDVWFRDNGSAFRTLDGDWRRAIWYYIKP